MSNSLQLSGARGEEDLSEQQAKKDEVQATLEQQDVEVPRAAEIPIPYEDIILPSELEEENVKAQAVVKKNISDKQRASLEKARAARAEKARLRRQGQDLGTEPETQPSLLLKFQELMEQKFSEVNKTLDGLKKTLPSESSIEVVSNQPRYKEKTVQAPSNDDDVLEFNLLDRPVREPMDTIPRQSYESYRQAEDLERERKFYESLKRRFPSSRPVALEPQPIEKRMKQDKNFFMF